MDAHIWTLIYESIYESIYGSIYESIYGYTYTRTSERERERGGRGGGGDGGTILLFQALKLLVCAFKMTTFRKVYTHSGFVHGAIVNGEGVS